MGNLSSWEHYETFGGWPEPGEAYVSLEDADSLRKAVREEHRIDGPNGYEAACPGVGCWCVGCRGAA